MGTEFPGSSERPDQLGTLGKISVYFVTVNASILVAWWKYIKGNASSCGSLGAMTNWKGAPGNPLQVQRRKKAGII